jgi:predicted NBD/HSP70 family sugar kinase
VSTTQTTVAVADLVGRVVERETFDTDPDVTITLRRLTSAVQRFIRGNTNIEGIGVSIPGVVDPESRVALFIPHFKWRNWPLASELRKSTGLPVTVDNDANAAALAELWLGRPEIRDVRDFILVLVHEGLGTGIIFDGQVYQGVAGAAGEFGHMTIGKGAPVVCAAGSDECWEAFASERAALARYKQRRDGKADSDLTFGKLIDNAFAKDEDARAALVETAHYLGLGIANLTKGLSPEAVILAGDISRAWPLIADELRRTLAANTICSDLVSAPVLPSTLGEDTRLMGALSLVLAGKFASVVPA